MRDTYIPRATRLTQIQLAAKDTLAKIGEVLTAAKQEEKYDCHYRLGIGKLNHIKTCTRPDRTYAMHQYVRFFVDPSQNQTICWKSKL